MDRYEAERERLIERIHKIEPNTVPEELEVLSVGELAALLKFAETMQLKQQQRMAAGQ